MHVQYGSDHREHTICSVEQQQRIGKGTETFNSSAQARGREKNSCASAENTISHRSESNQYTMEWKRQRIASTRCNAALYLVAEAAADSPRRPTTGVRFLRQLQPPSPRPPLLHRHLLLLLLLAIETADRSPWSLSPTQPGLWQRRVYCSSHPRLLACNESYKSTPQRRLNAVEKGY